MSGSGFFGITYHGPQNAFQHNTRDIFNIVDANDVAFLRQCFQSHAGEDSMVQLSLLPEVISSFYNGRSASEHELEVLMRHMSKDEATAIDLDAFLQGCLDAAGDPSC